MTNLNMHFNLIKNMNNIISYMKIKIHNNHWESDEWSIEYIVDVPESPLYCFYIKDHGHNFLVAYDDMTHVYIQDKHNEPNLEEWEWEWWTKDSNTGHVRSIHGTWLMFDEFKNEFFQTDEINDLTLKITEM